MSSHEEFAGIAPSVRVVISGATTGLEVHERALAGWPVLESTKGGTCNTVVNNPKFANPATGSM